MERATKLARVREVADRLRARYGELVWHSQTDPLENLIETVLSQNTNDRNRDMAFAALKARYPTWEAVLQASVEELAATIRSAGLNRQKAARIQKILRWLREEQGAFSLDYLRDLGKEDALAGLTRFNGVGKKTAGIVLTFSLDKPYFPVDTHIKRVTRRLGWVEPGEDPHDTMNALVPEELVHAFHLYLIQHGRDTCKARKPRCEACPLNDLCPVFTEGRAP